LLDVMAHPVPAEWRRMIKSGELISTNQAADLAGVRPGTIRQWVRRGHLRPVNPGHRVALFHRDEVERCDQERRSVGLLDE
jgi:excisionase family DNA binding protein